MRLRPAWIFALACAATPRPVHAQALDHTERVRLAEFVATLQDDLRRGDAAALAHLVRFPLEVTQLGSQPQDIRDSAQFTRDFDALFDSAVRTAVLSQQPDSVRGTWRDVMVGSGTDWLDVGCVDRNAGDNCIKVWGLNLTDVIVQDVSPRHGFRMTLDFGYGSFGTACDSCHARPRSVAANLDMSFGLMLGPHVMVSAGMANWGHGVARDTNEVVAAFPLSVRLYPRSRSGPFLEGGVDYTDYSVERGQSPFIPFLEQSKGTAVDGGGWGFHLGVGTDIVPVRYGLLGARIEYEHSDVGTLHNRRGVPVASGWRHNLLLLEATVTMYDKGRLVPH